MSDKLVFVTGAAGFIGARFVESCNFNGMPVASVDHSAHFGARPEHHGFDFGTMVDLHESADWLHANSARVSAIVHLGAISQTTSEDVELVRRYNLEYSQTLWNLATEKKIPFIYASSAATYGDGAHGFDDEENNLVRLEPNSPYARSKHSFDLWALGQEKMGFCPPAWSGYKFFNVYGYGERHKTGMWSIVLNTYEQVRQGGRVKLFESDHTEFPHGGQTRDFIYIDDVLDTLWFATELPISRGIYNLGTGNPATFLEMAKWTIEAMGREAEIEFVPMPKEVSRNYQYFTCAKMENLKKTGARLELTPHCEAIAEYVGQLDEYYRQSKLRESQPFEQVTSP